MSQMNQRKSKVERTKGVPQRKSLAGPGLLTGFSSQRRSSRFDKESGPSGEDEEIKHVTSAFKDYTGLEGPIKISSINDVRNEILCCKYSEDYNYLAVGCSNGNLVLYHTENGEESSVLNEEGNISAVTAMSHRPASKSYPITNCITCTYSDGFVRCWNYNFNQSLYTIKENRETFGITYHPRYPKFVTYGDDAKIYLYDEESKTQERILTGSNNPKIHDGHTSRVFAACFHPKSNYELITGGWDDVIQFWDLRQPHAIRQIAGVHMCGEGLDINPKGTQILACAFQSQNSLQTFDYGSGNLIGKLPKEEQCCKLYVGKYVSNDFVACGGATPNVFRLVDLTSYTITAEVLGLPYAIYSLDLGPQKKGNISQSAIGAIPEIAFVSGKKLYRADFN